MQVVLDAADGRASARRVVLDEEVVELPAQRQHATAHLSVRAALGTGQQHVRVVDGGTVALGQPVR